MLQGLILVLAIGLIPVGVLGLGKLVEGINKRIERRVQNGVKSSRYKVVPGKSA